jgi:hypothetical protein
LKEICSVVGVERKAFMAFGDLFNVGQNLERIL